MNITRSYLLAQECNNSPSSIVQERPSTINLQIRPRSSNNPPPSNLLTKVAVKISRSKWYVFLRRVFHYQNGPSSELGPNPFDSVNWIVAEFLTQAVQICLIAYTLVVSERERPVWPMRLWATGYAFGCFMGLVLHCRRYQLLYVDRLGGDLSSMLEQQTISHDRTHTRFQSIQRCKTSLELLFAIWFVMGNVWVFDSRLASSYNRAPRLHVLCVSLLAWNALSYSFPLVLFVLLCCCVPLLSSLSGYNMNVGSEEKGATEEQIQCLPKWKYKGILGNDDQSEECCICLAKYMESEEIRQLLPCTHTFHLQCVDQWLKITSCCPLCKQEILK